MEWAELTGTGKPLCQAGLHYNPLHHIPPNQAVLFRFSSLETFAFKKHFTPTAIAAPCFKKGEGLSLQRQVSVMSSQSESRRKVVRVWHHLTLAMLYQLHLLTTLD